MKVDNLILFQKMYDFSLWLMPHTEKYPKIQRFALAKSINETTIELLSEIISMNYEKLREEKTRKVDEINVKLDKLRIMIRLSMDFKYISIKQYQYAIEKLDEIGKITGGFKRGDKP